MRVLQVLVLVISVSTAARYPISASWFGDRYTQNEVDSSLDKFTEDVAGDTVLLRGAEFQNRTKLDLKQDPLFEKCVVSKYCILHM